MILLLEYNFRGGTSIVKGDKYEKLNESKEMLYSVANNLYGWAMGECLPYDEIKIATSNKLEDFVNTADDSDIGYFTEVLSK